ncbi:hypothetical protein FQN57_005780 [Myotisia sp. PD_48]|nr:hypothetical protein FQN57_005780 [Myotisia sp. PD_48]
MSTRIFTRPVAGAVQLTQRSLTATRKFSSTHPNGESDQPSTPNRSAGQRGAPGIQGQQTTRRKFMVQQVQDVYSRSSSEGPNIKRPAANPSRAPFMRPKVDNEILKQRLRERASRSGRPQIRSAIMSGPPGASRRPRDQTRPNNRPRRKQLSRRAQEEEDDENAPLSADIQKYHEELKEKQLQERKPVRYNPEPYSVAKLQETWPSLPLEGAEVGNKSSIIQKLAWMSDTFVGDVELNEQLAKRVVDGKRVFFTSNDQKNEVMQRVKEMAEDQAKQLTEKQGKVVKPDDIEFEPLGQTEREGMLGPLVAGTYQLPKNDKTVSPTIANVMKNLANNSTYHSAHTQQFMAKLMTALPAPKKAPKKQQIVK